MPKIRFQKRFDKAYHQLPEKIQIKGEKAIRLLAQDPRHPSLQTKLIQGMEGIFEARVDIKYRLTYERLPGDQLRLRTVGPHDETLRNL